MSTWPLLEGIKLLTMLYVSKRALNLFYFINRINTLRGNQIPAQLYQLLAGPTLSHVK